MVGRPDVLVGWLRELLAKSGDSCAECMKYKARSCKATLLSWLATSEICSYEERRLLGHHLDPKMVSMATYSRHVYAPIAVKVARFLGSIKRGDHDPQMPLAERVRISLAPACENQQEEDYALEEDVDAERKRRIWQS